jgi:leucyl aminopeptidase
MDVALEAGSLLQIKTPLLVVNLFEGVAEPGGATAAVDEALGGLLRRLIQQGELRGEVCQVVVVHNPNPGGNGLAAERVAVVGLGKREQFDLEAVRVASASAVRKARELRVTELATVVHGAGAGGLDFAAAVRAVAEAGLLATYDFRQYRTDDDPPPELTRLTIVERDPERVEQARPAARLAEQTAAAVILARDLATAPANQVTPTYLAERAREVAERDGLQYEVFWKEDLQRLGMGGLLAVNQGSAQPPCLVVMRYRSEQPGAKTLAVVGKGITFDSGGISIKPAENMGAMKQDMSGAAAVIAFCQLAAQSKSPVNLLGIFAATENLPSGTAYKPGDVYRAYNGKTMEIVNTDAEGRVILSDALSYAAEQQPDAIVDLATLTGACVVALGNYASGAMGNDERLIELLRRAGDATGERVWPLPLWPEYLKEIESPVADIKNAAGRKAGAITGAAFLKHFVGEVPWVHLDIAGTAWVEDQRWVPPYLTKHLATGVGVRLLEEFARLWAAEQDGR